MSDTIRQSRIFYNDKVAPMIRSNFPEYEGRIAAGLAGEGSECWGFDDGFSKDHDWGLSLCLWLTDQDYAVIGAQLEQAYRELLTERLDGTRLESRRGVQTISGFYQGLLGFSFDTDTPSMTDAHWFYAEESKLSAATNGEVFRDDLGSFTRVREMLMNYYPDKVYKMKLANALHDYSATLQANYPRCMARGEYVAAALCIAKGIEAAMRLAFMLERRYMPYYKWSHRALEALADLNLSSDPGQNSTAPVIPDLPFTESRIGENGIVRISQLTEELACARPQQDAWNGFAYDSRRINYDDAVVRISEEIAGVIADMMIEQGLTDSRETFLEVHCEKIAASV